MFLLQCRGRILQRVKHIDPAARNLCFNAGIRDQYETLPVIDTPTVVQPRQQHQRISGYGQGVLDSDNAPPRKPDAGTHVERGNRDLTAAKCQATPWGPEARIEIRDPVRPSPASGISFPETVP